MASTKVVVDPITRIEGHLRIEVQADAGMISGSWATATMFRGIETIMTGRDPRDAWAFTQRICGVCTTVHALASVRAVEDALDIRIPANANIIRNLVHGMQYIQDHVIHFYHLHALDWVDVVSAVGADPNKAAALARSISPWPNNDAAHFAAVQARLKKFVASGQLGIFANRPTSCRPRRTSWRSRTTSRRSTGSATSSACTRSSAARTRTRTSSSAAWRAPSTSTRSRPSTRCAWPT
jgi:[NiFe] hydrogenase large subunit/hydrogenase large subunit